MPDSRLGHRSPPFPPAPKFPPRTLRKISYLPTMIYPRTSVRYLSSDQRLSPGLIPSRDNGAATLHGSATPLLSR